MIEPNRVLEAARTALRTEPRVDAEHHPMLLEFADGTLTIQGEVGEIAAKKLALQRVAAIEGVAWVVDHLHLEPAVKMGDHEIRDHVRNALLSEPALAEAALLVETDGKRELVRSPPAGRGEICVSVEGGVVALEGELPSRAHKRLAALLAWWVPGTRDVVDGMAVVPYERDNDDEITDSVRTRSRRTHSSTPVKSESTRTRQK